MREPEDRSKEEGPRRLDVELVRRGLAVSRAQGRAAIEARKVRVDGVLAAKPGQAVSAHAAIAFEPAHPWVSRGGVKLAHALDVFGVRTKGRICLDIGASTGGFTQVLLSLGAARVFAVDVGRGQLAPTIAADRRVTSLEATDARALTLQQIGEAPELIVADASFIGLAKVLHRPLQLAADRAELVALFKPQFEVGPAHIGKRGLVKDFAAADTAASAFEVWLTTQSWRVRAWTASPILGGDGNAERLVHAVREKTRQ